MTRAEIEGIEAGWVVKLLVRGQVVRTMGDVPIPQIGSSVHWYMTMDDKRRGAEDAPRDVEGKVTHVEYAYGHTNGYTHTEVLVTIQPLFT